jgi:O-antigen/teichoic acid export membrane protein
MAMITATAQGAVQVIAFLCGLLVIRLLSVEQYAWYTIGNTMLGMVSVLSDGGIYTGVMAGGGRVWQDRAKLGSVLATGLALRRKFAVGAVVVTTPLLVVLLHRNSAPPLAIVLIALALIPAVWASLSDSMLQIIPKLHRKIWPLQRNQLEVGGGRLALTALLAFLFPWAWICIVAAGIPRVIGNIRLRRMTFRDADPRAVPDPQQRAQILSIVRRVMPQSIYYCISGQLTVWLLSVAGTTAAVAQLGALGRVVVITSVFTALFATLAYPSFARCHPVRAMLVRRLVPVLAAATVLALGLVALSWLFPGPILLVLGPEYAGLEYQLFLAMVAAGVSLVSGTTSGMMSSRGWPVNPVLHISLNFAAIVSGIFIFDVTDLAGVLKFNIFVNMSYLVTQLINAVWRLGPLNDE